MGIRQRCWTAIALYLLSLPGSQLTSANAMVLASGESGTNTADPNGKKCTLRGDRFVELLLPRRPGRPKGLSSAAW